MGVPEIKKCGERDTSVYTVINLLNNIKKQEPVKIELHLTR